MQSTAPCNIKIDIADTAVDEAGACAAPATDEPFDPTKINIVPKQDTLRNLIDRLRQGKVDTHVELQRSADRWDPIKMSLFIESILIRLPLPAFYFDAADDNKWLIVDGLQRLSAIRQFIIEADDNQRLSLRGLEYLQEFNGKKYHELPRAYQRCIDDCPTTLFIIQPGTPREIRTSIFRRINTPGMAFNRQEIRNAMAKPAIREYLAELARNEYLLKLVGNQQHRMVDQELVLRFVAFYALDYPQATKNVALFLDKIVEHLAAADHDELARLAAAYAVAMQRSWEIFHEDAFVMPGGNDDEPTVHKNAALFEVWTVALAKLSAEEFTKLTIERERLMAVHSELLVNDAAYVRAITSATEQSEHFTFRQTIVAKIIKELLND